MTHAHEISIFVNILFNFKKKKLAWKELKASLETLYFNIVKNQEFELITSSHFKNLISPKGNPHGTVSETVFNSGTVFKKFKVIASMPILRLYFRFKKKKDFSDIPVNLGMGVLVLILHLFKLKFNFDDIITYFLEVLSGCQQITFVTLKGFCLLSKKIPLPAPNGQYQDG